MYDSYLFLLVYIFAVNDISLCPINSFEALIGAPAPNNLCRMSEYAKT